MGKNKISTLIYLFFLAIAQTADAQGYDSIPLPKKFFNAGLIGTLSTNGEATDEINNNISISLLYGTSKNIYGLALCPMISDIQSSMHGLQIGGFNGAKDVRGSQMGFANGASFLKGIQIGYWNFINEHSGGVQIGLINDRKSNGLQIGLINLADHNDFTIGLVNIVKNGDMQVGLQLDEMSGLTATFRSGGRYLYGIVGIGCSFGSSLNHTILEGGLGFHILRANLLKIDTEIAITYFSKPFVYVGSPEEAERKAKEHDFKEAVRLSLRLLPKYHINNQIEVFAGPSINYLHSKCMDNYRIFPSHYIQRKFTSTSLKQVHWGWTAGVQYKF